jgi:hypothetical protein
MKSCFNKCQSNIIFSTKKYCSWLHQFTVYLYGKNVFLSKKQYCIENAIKICPVMEKKKQYNKICKNKIIKKNMVHTWNPSLHLTEQETGRSLWRAIPRIMKVYSLQRTATAMTLHGRNSMRYTPQYTVMSPLQSKCQPSKAFHPAAAEQYHLRCTCVDSSISYMTKTAKTNSVLMLSIGEYFETTHCWLVRSIWF